MRLLRAFVLTVLVTGAAAVAPAGAVSSDDSFGDEQWNLDIVGAETAWATGTGEGATIAVVDTGVDLDHDDLASQVVDHVSCIGADDDQSKCSGSGQDDHGHGSHVAGIAAAATGNGKGVAGTAPGARIMAVRVLQKAEPDPSKPDEEPGATGNVPDIRAGIKWAADHGADVINLSLGENTVLIKQLFGSGLAPAIEYAWAKGSIPVIASGNLDNLFSSSSGYANLPVVVVTATNEDDEKASYATNTGNTRWPMAAPGGESGEVECSDEHPEACEPLVLSTWLQSDDDHGYAYAQGTSMAAPHVSGAAAVLRSLGLSPQETVDRLLDTAKDIGSPGVDSRTGHGRLDLAAAVRGLRGSGGGNRPASSSSTTTTQVVSGPTVPPTTVPAQVLHGSAEGSGPQAEAPSAPSATELPTTTRERSAAADGDGDGDDPRVAAAPPSPAPDSSTDLGPWPVVAAILIVLVGAGLRQTRTLLFAPRR